MNIKTILLGACMATALAACGGGGVDASSAVSNDVPASATATPLAYTQFVGSLALDDHGEPLSVDQLDPPVTETGEPLTL